jgi:hypothetical protein
MTSTSSLDGQFRRVAHRPSAVEAPYIRSGRPLLGTHQIDAATEQSPRPTIDRPTPKAPASGGVSFSLDVHSPADAHFRCDVEAPNIRDGQSTFDTHLVHVVSEQSPRPTIDRPTPIDDPLSILDATSGPQTSVVATPCPMPIALVPLRSSPPARP